MTFSVPSFLAAATNLSMPPRAAALVAVAAPLESLVFFWGGEHATVARASPPATINARPRVDVIRTVPPRSGYRRARICPQRTLCWGTRQHHACGVTTGPRQRDERLATRSGRNGLRIPC